MLAAMSSATYHHGDLQGRDPEPRPRRLVAERGADGISLRELARAAGVSHAAPAHHFTDRRGLFTALATEGFRLLARRSPTRGRMFVDAALAYVRFAIEHPGPLPVMFDKSLYDGSDPDWPPPRPPRRGADPRASATLEIRTRRPIRRRRARGMVTGARLFDAVAQRRGQRRRQTDPDGHRRHGSRRCCSRADRAR